MRSETRKREFLASSSSGSLGSIITRLAPSDTQAIEQGRVFVDDRRTRDPAYSVASGARVTWYAERSALVPPDDLAFSIAARRRDWVVANKPAAWSCEPDRAGHAASLRDAVADELGTSDIHVLTRLDVGVSGLVLMALGHSACRAATELQSQHRIAKYYHALVSGVPGVSTTWDGPPCANKEARTEISVLGEPCVVAAASQKTLAVSLLSVRPITGRKHQIRIHSSHYGYPLLGDVRYGGPTRLTQPNGSVLSVKRVMLHAYRLVIPWEREPWSITCAPPRDFEGLWTSLGGDPAHLHLPLPA